MNFYQILTAHDAGRDDGEFWSIRSNPLLDTFQTAHFSGGLPRESEVERLPVFVYSDQKLLDVVRGSSFYDSFFVSERLQKMLCRLHLPADQIHFFEKTNVEWRGSKHRFFWMQTLKPTDGDRFFDFEKSCFCSLDLPEMFAVERVEEFQKKGGGRLDWASSLVFLTASAAEFDLFRLPCGNLGQSLFCSEKLKNEFEKGDFTGISFKNAPFLQVSKIRKTAKPSPPPSVFELNFDQNWLADWRRNQPKPEPADGQNNVAVWQKTLIEKLENPPPPELSKMIEKWTRPSLVAPLFGDEKELKKTEIEARPAASRLFGRPFLSKNFDWPRTDSGRALAFLAQIDLAAMPKNDDLPASGSLVFFIDVYGCTNGWPTEMDRSRVFFFENTSGFEWTDFPENLPLNGDFRPIRLDFQPFFDLPDNRWPELFEEKDWPDKNVFDQFLEEITGEDGYFSKGPKLLGWPRSVQGPVELDAEMRQTHGEDWAIFESKKAEILPASRSWRLLFQFEAGEIGLGDQLTDPTICFLIREKDLRERAFSRAVLTVQAT